MRRLDGPAELLMTHRYLPLFTFAATSLLVVACGAKVPTKPEAAAALSKAIESKVTRTLPASAYCMSVDPDYSFATMGQVDFVEMFQNLSDKAPLLDATTAGVVLVELKDSRVGPGGRSPDPSCDAVTTRPVRLAIVRPTLTPKGTAAGVRLDTPIEVATREVVDVTDVRAERGGVAVKYTWAWKPTKMGEAIGYTAAAPKEAVARLRRSDGGWAVENAGLK